MMLSIDHWVAIGCALVQVATQIAVAYWMMRHLNTTG